jgi:hypothetical protein
VIEKLPNKANRLGVEGEYRWLARRDRCNFRIVIVAQPWI